MRLSGVYELHYHSADIKVMHVLNKAVQVFHNLSSLFERRGGNDPTQRWTGSFKSSKKKGVGELRVCIR